MGTPRGHVWEWDDGDPEGKCLPSISQQLKIIKTLKISLVGVLAAVTIMSCLVVLVLILRKRRRASEPNMAPVFLRSEDNSSEYMELTGAERQPLEETVRQIQTGEEEEYVAFQNTPEVGDLRDEDHIYELIE